MPKISVRPGSVGPEEEDSGGTVNYLPLSLPFFSDHSEECEKASRLCRAWTMGCCCGDRWETGEPGF